MRYDGAKVQTIPLINESQTDVQRCMFETQGKLIPVQRALGLPPTMGNTWAVGECVENLCRFTLRGRGTFNFPEWRLGLHDQYTRPPTSRATQLQCALEAPVWLTGINFPAGINIGHYSHD